jgi:ectoine hydroxylase-related dioxygenase (phytanoyl-CoA dioxygenase family)
MTAKADVDPTVAECLERDGYAVVTDALRPELVDELIEAVGRVPEGPGIHRNGSPYAIRNLFEVLPAAKRVLEERALAELVSAGLGEGAVCVRALFLDRAPRAGWRVPWHQEATVALKERVEVTGFGPWSVKDGVQHVMAPPGTLSAMLAVRAFLDDCGIDEGGLDVIPASHQYGRLPEDSIEPFTRYDARPVPLRRGGLLAIRPLVIRRSAAPTRPGPRRVIHLDFCVRRLPLPLEWQATYPISP